MKRIMTLKDIAKMFGVHDSTVRRWCGECRKGKGNFLLPFTPPHHKCLWLESDILRFIESQNIPPPITPTSSKKRRKEEKANHARKEKVQAALARHTSKSK
jgi:hypothetical protein